MLHFSGTEIVLECAKIVNCDCGGVKDDLPKSGPGVPMDLKTEVRNTTISDGLVHRRQYLKDAQCDTIVSNYSSLKLTLYTDRLTAVSGLTSTKFMANEEGTSVYLAGLW